MHKSDNEPTFCRYDDLMRNLPLPEYSDPEGNLNLASHLPSFFVRPDLGPRLCCAYGMTSNKGRKLAPIAKCTFVFLNPLFLSCDLRRCGSISGPGLWDCQPPCGGLRCCLCSGLCWSSQRERGPVKDWYGPLSSLELSVHNFVH